MMETLTNRGRRPFVGLAVAHDDGPYEPQNYLAVEAQQLQQLLVPPRHFAALSGAGWADPGHALARHRRRSRGAATLRGLFGSYGSITRHSKSVGSNRLVQKLLSETLNQNDTALGN